VARFSLCVILEGEGLCDKSKVMSQKLSSGSCHGRLLDFVTDVDRAHEM
jgi:hypothetical protein